MEKFLEIIKLILKFIAICIAKLIYYTVKLCIAIGHYSVLLFRATRKYVVKFIEEKRWNAALSDIKSKKDLPWMPQNKSTESLGVSPKTNKKVKDYPKVDRNIKDEEDEEPVVVSQPSWRTQPVMVKIEKPKAAKVEQSKPIPSEEKQVEKVKELVAAEPKEQTIVVPDPPISYVQTDDIDDPVRVAEVVAKVNEKPFEVVDEPVMTVDEPVMTVNESVKVADELLIKVADEPVKVVDEPVIAVDESIIKVVDKPKKVVVEPVKIADEPVEVVDEPAKIADDVKIVNESVSVVKTPDGPSIISFDDNSFAEPSADEDENVDDNVGEPIESQPEESHSITFKFIENEDEEPEKSVTETIEEVQDVAVQSQEDSFVEQPVAEETPAEQPHDVSQTAEVQATPAIEIPEESTIETLEATLETPEPAPEEPETVPEETLEATLESPEPAPEESETVPEEAQNTEPKEPEATPDVAQEAAPEIPVAAPKVSETKPQEKQKLPEDDVDDDLGQHDRYVEGSLFGF